MSEQDIIESVFGWVGTIISIFFYIAPVAPFLKVLKEQMTYKDSPGILLICSFMNCILWADYGLAKNTTQVYVANSLGSTITLMWITIYLIYLGKKSFCLAFSLNILLLVLIAAISYIFYFIVDVYITGLIAMVFNVLMYAAPGEKIIQVIKTGKYELIPIFSSIGGIACSLCWFIFGIYQNDKNIIIPNGLGLIFAFLQIVVYLIYYCKRNNKNDKNNKEFSHENINEKEKN